MAASMNNNRLRTRLAELTDALGGLRMLIAGTPRMSCRDVNDFSDLCWREVDHTALSQRIIIHHWTTGRQKDSASECRLALTHSMDHPRPCDSDRLAKGNHAIVWTFNFEKLVKVFNRLDCSEKVGFVEKGESLIVTC
jgi:hypothetical protein